MNSDQQTTSLEAVIWEPEVPEPVTLTLQGAIIHRNMDYDSWASWIANMEAMNDATRWAIGDLLVWGEKAFPDRYTQVMGGTGLAYQTLLNYAWIARKFPMGERVEGVSWSHHRAVAGVEGARDLLIRAREENLNALETRGLAGTKDNAAARYLLSRKASSVSIRERSNGVFWNITFSTDAGEIEVRIDEERAKRYPGDPDTYRFNEAVMRLCERRLATPALLESIAQAWEKRTKDG